ncbi:MAG: hypothetical protein KDD70_01530 [Bdellovibrionales bacterium]|nr:hypothetical protein [Bdellovibrionales bacterium]
MKCKLHLLTFVAFVLLPMHAFALGTVLSDSELFESDGTTCGLIGGTWQPGTLKKGKFTSHNDKAKALGKKAKKASGSLKTKLTKQKKKFSALAKSQSITCAAGDGGIGAISRGQKFYASGCALSGCHGGENPSMYAGYTSAQIEAAFQSVSEMKSLTPPSGTNMSDLVAYLGSL